MTKKDYELIANSIAEFIRSSEKAMGDTYDLKTVLYLTGWIGQDLANENPKFDISKFRGVVEKTVHNTYGTN